METSIIIKLYNCIIPINPHNPPDLVNFRKLIDLNPGINLNATIDVPGLELSNVLCLATIFARVDMVKLLIERGAEMQTKNLDNSIRCDALHEAIKRYIYPFRDSPYSADTLWGADSSWPEKLERYCEIIKYFLENGANCNSVHVDRYNSPCHKNETVLMEICGFYNHSYNSNKYMFKVAKLLLDNGADRDLVNDKGDTAEKIATRCGNFKFAAYIRDYQPLLVSKGCYMEGQ